MSETRDIPLSDLVEPRLILRMVDRDGVDFMELCDSIAEHGVLNAICVRPAPQAGKWEVVDGNYRFRAARSVGLETIPCVIRHDLTDFDAMAMQIQANAIRPETKPIEFARQLKRLISHNPDMTMADVAMMVKKRPAWVREMLGLLELSPELLIAIDRGEIPITNAYMLAKIPDKFRPDFVDQAKTHSAAEFRLLAGGFIKKFAEAVRQGKLDTLFVDEFEAVPFLRPVKIISHEYRTRTLAASYLVALDCKTPVDGWYAALEWALNLDAASVAQRRQAALDRVRTHLQQTLGGNTRDELNDN